MPADLPLASLDMMSCIIMTSAPHRRMQAAAFESAVAADQSSNLLELAMRAGRASPDASSG